MGMEYISGKLLIWAKKPGIVILNVQPGKPQQTARTERYNPTVLQQWFGQYMIETFEEARILPQKWLWAYDNDRPNVGISGITSAQKLKMAV